MSIESAKAFIKRLKTDKEFTKTVSECNDMESLTTFAKEAGYDFTPDEITGLLSALSDDELAQVAAGSSPLSGISVTIYKDERLL